MAKQKPPRVIHSNLDNYMQTNLIQPDVVAKAVPLSDSTTWFQLKYTTEVPLRTTSHRLMICSPPYLYLAFCSTSPLRVMLLEVYYV